MADAEGGEDNSWKFGVAFVGEQIRIHQQSWQYQLASMMVHHSLSRKHYICKGNN